MDEGEKLEAAGKPDQALTFYVRGRQWSHAARLALSLNRNLEAANYCMQAGRPYDAAVCFQKVGALKDCLNALKQVPSESPRYRSACVHAVRVAQLAETSLDSISSFLLPFISSKPTSRIEAATLNQIATAFAQTDKVRFAGSIYRSVLSVFPDDAEATEALALLASLPDPASAPLPLRDVAPPRPSANPPRPSAHPPASAPRPSAGAPQPSRPDRGSRGHRLGEQLREEGKITPAELERILKAHPEVKGSDLLLGEALVAEGCLTTVDIIKALSEHSGIPYLDDEALIEAVAPTAAQGLTLEQAERWKVVPITLIDRHLTVAMRDPRDIGHLDQLRFASGLNQITGVFATELGIRQGVRKLYHGETLEDQWRGKVWDQTSQDQAPAPFSDRHTRTRERQFDTQDLEKRLKAEATGEASMARPPSSGTIEMQVLPTVGSMFAGRFRIEALIGEGGSATIFKAVDTELNEAIALKLFRPATPAEAEHLIARFKLELSLSRQLSHPNIIRLFDLGSHEGWRYLTMELLEGHDLATVLEALGKPMPFELGLRYLEQICNGLQMAHERGVIHRDIKPQNLFITSDGVAKVMDFGIAKRARAPGVTVAGMIVGTPEYMSPEQATGFSEVTPLTDLYALGATAYMMFTGKPPFTYPELIALLNAHATEKPASPRLRNPEIDPELEQVILKLLEKDPAKRFATARALGEALQAIRERLDEMGA
ncbi:MAG: serine/threonine protein kinase [Myxococcaceae bacterium]|nr:serine/threonine protein kinase [Myxococcaceae bacterium]